MFLAILIHFASLYWWVLTKIWFLNFSILKYTKVQQENIGQASFEKKTSIVHLSWYVGIFDIHIQLGQNYLQYSQKITKVHQNITQGHHSSIWVFGSACIYDICLHTNFYINWSKKIKIIQIGWMTEVKTELDTLD